MKINYVPYIVQESQRYLVANLKKLLGEKGAIAYWLDICSNSYKTGGWTYDQLKVWQRFVNSILEAEGGFDSLSKNRQRHLYELYDYMSTMTYEEFYRFFHICPIHGWLHSGMLLSEFPVVEVKTPIPENVAQEKFPFTGTFESAPFMGEAGNRFACSACMSLKRAWVELDCYETSEFQGLTAGDFPNKHLLPERLIVSRTDPFHVHRKQDLPLEEIIALDDAHRKRSLCDLDLREVGAEAIDKRLADLQHDESRGYFHRGESDWLLQFKQAPTTAFNRFEAWVLHRLNHLVLRSPLERLGPTDEKGLCEAQGEWRSVEIIDRHWFGDTRSFMLLNPRVAALFQDRDDTFSVEIQIAGKPSGPQKEALLCAWEVLYNLHLYFDLVNKDSIAEEEWSHVTLMFPYQSGKEEAAFFELIHAAEGVEFDYTFMGKRYADSQSELTKGTIHNGVRYFVNESLQKLRHIDRIRNDPAFQAIEDRIEEIEVKGPELIDDLCDIAEKHREYFEYDDAYREVDHGLKWRKPGRKDDDESEADLDINRRDRFQATPLMWACRDAASFWPREKVNSLLDAGADPNLTDYMGKTAATYCFAFKRLFEKFDLHLKDLEPVVKRLVKAGADLSLGYNPLMFTATYNRTDMITWLRTYGIDPNACLPDGNTALHIAAAEGCFEAAELLVEMGANPACRNKKGQLPLDLAVSNSNATTPASPIPVYDYGRDPEKTPQWKPLIEFLKSISSV